MRAHTAGWLLVQWLRGGQHKGGKSTKMPAQKRFKEFNTHLAKTERKQPKRNEACR
jgi:hypothetical protein